MIPLVSTDDHPREACGVFGVYAPGREIARLAFFGLFALQHRGQESAGIVTSDGQRACIHKGMGLVAQVFNEANLAPLTGHLAIGHTRYSTTGSSNIRNAALPDRNDVRTARGGAGRPTNAPSLRMLLARWTVRDE
jgi:amidophosphoribosyltransferase